jgi:hypothetical protein
LHGACGWGGGTAADSVSAGRADTDSLYGDRAGAASPACGDVCSGGMVDIEGGGLARERRP